MYLIVLTQHDIMFSKWLLFLFLIKLNKSNFSDSTRGSQNYKGLPDASQKLDTKQRVSFFV